MIGYGRMGYNDPYLHFKKKTDYDYYVAHNDVSDGFRFYAKDTIDYRESNTESSTTLTKLCYLTIETPCMNKFEVDDIVVSLKDGKVWRVNVPTISDDGQNKQYCSRPRKVTILELVG